MTRDDSKALLVDFGGVLTTSVLDSFRAFCRNEDIDYEVFRRVTIDAARSDDSPFVLVETGRISQEDFDHRLGEVLSAAVGRPVDARDIKRRLFAAAQPDEAMIAAVRSARRAGVRTALVSNSWGGQDYPTDVLAELLDEVVISGDVGLRKPEPEIYLLAAQRLGVAPRHCIFVDDFRVNVEGAVAVGMAGVLHRSAAETIPVLERFLAVPLAPRP